MRLLVTNDDGIESVFLHELVRALLDARHEVLVVAPRHEQSWVGAAKSRSRPVRSAVEERGLGCPTWIVDGTPSDCVNIALDHLLPDQPEAILSGINVGLNASLGFILASGTIAGAWEGALHGLPAVAFSQDISYETYENLKDQKGIPSAELLRTLRASAAHAAELGPRLAASTAQNGFVVHNINFPLSCTALTQVKVTVPARVVVPKLFTPKSVEGTHSLVFNYGNDLSPPDLLTDRAALGTGFISHTILDYSVLGH